MSGGSPFTMRKSLIATMKRKRVGRTFDGGGIVGLMRARSGQMLGGSARIRSSKGFVTREGEYKLGKQESKRRLVYQENRLRRGSIFDQVIDQFNVPSDDIVHGGIPSRAGHSAQVAPIDDGSGAPADYVLDAGGNMEVIADDSGSFKEKHSSKSINNSKDSFFMTDDDREADPEKDALPYPSKRGTNIRHSKNRQSLFDRSSHEYETQMAELENPYVLCPYHLTRRLWDLLISAIVVYLMIFIPIEICVLWYQPSGPKKILSYFMDTLFWVDILLNFNTGFVHYGVLYMNRSDIARHYVGGWFIIDLIGNFPFEAVLGDVEGSQRKSVKLLKWAKLPKLLRIGRVIKYMKQYIKFASILGLVFTAMFVLHFLACLWIFLMYEEDDQGEMTLLGLWVRAAHEVIIQMMGSVPPEFLVDTNAQALAQSVTTLSALLVAEKQLNSSALDEFVKRMETNIEIHDSDNCRNYGCTGYPHFFSLICTTVGVSFIILFGANVSVLVNNRTSSYTKFRTRVDRLQVEMGYHNLPHDLQTRVMKYYDYLWLNQKHHERDSLHRDPHLSDTLRKEIGRHIHSDILNSTPLFNKCSKDCLSMVALKLKTWIALPNDVIVEQGDVGREFFMIALGSVEVIEKHTGQIVTSLAEGSFFGEIALLAKCCRSHSVVAKTLSELNVLSKEDFGLIVKDYPRLLKNAWHAAKKRQRDHLNRNKKLRLAVGVVEGADIQATEKMTLIPSYTQTLRNFKVIAKEGGQESRATVPDKLSPSAEVQSGATSVDSSQGSKNGSERPAQENLASS